MTNLLVINSSPMGDASVSRQLTAAFVEKFTAKKGDVTVTEHDTSAMDLPHVNGEILGAFFTPADQRDEGQKAHVERSDALIAAIRSADAIVIGAPMHNFSIPSTLKAYIDQITRVGETFHYTENGPAGLLEDKPVYVISTRGGDYSENGYPQLDFILPYLTSVLGFMGLQSVSALQANGLAMGDEAVASAVAQVKSELDTLLAA